MRKTFYLLTVAVMALMLSSCNPFIDRNPEPNTEDTVVLMEWQQIDSVTSHINLSDSSCITMTVDQDGSIVFTTQGISEFKVLSDTDEVQVQEDMNKYRVPAKDSLTIQADSININIQ